MPPWSASESPDAHILKLGFDEPLGSRVRAAQVRTDLSPRIDAALAEALGTGLPVIADDRWDPLLGAALLPPDAGTAGPATLAAARELGRSFSPAAHAVRIERLIGSPKPRAAKPPPPPRRRRRVLFLTSNGVGLGHLTRCMAVARRLPGTIDAVFLTLSTVGYLAADRGWHVEVFQHPNIAAEGPADWARSLRDRLTSAVAFHRIDVLVFDGNVPYMGLLQTLEALPDLPAVWLRRGLWQAGATIEPLEFSRLFDLVLEPGELAAAEDTGPTASAGDAVHLPPVVYPDRDECAPRREARQRLGLPGDGTAVLIQLGGGNNWDMTRARSVILDHLARHRDVVVCEARSPVALNRALDPRVTAIDAFPLAPLLPAFDFAVSAAGYNIFHELAFAGVPAVFVPNLNPEMDDQAGRARWAQRAGWAVDARSANSFSLIDALDCFLDSAERERAVRALRRIGWQNGAAEAARHIAALAHAADAVTVRQR